MFLRDYVGVFDSYVAKHGLTSLSVFCIISFLPLKWVTHFHCFVFEITYFILKRSFILIIVGPTRSRSAVCLTSTSRRWSPTSACCRWTAKTREITLDSISFRKRSTGWTRCRTRRRPTVLSSWVSFLFFQLFAFLRKFKYQPSCFVFHKVLNWIKFKHC